MIVGKYERINYPVTQKYYRMDNNPKIHEFGGVFYGSVAFGCFRLWERGHFTAIKQYKIKKIGYYDCF